MLYIDGAVIRFLKAWKEKNFLFIFMLTATTKAVEKELH